jgi:flagellar motor switch protein FliM
MATLTSSELAALLGPVVTPTAELPPQTHAQDVRWTKFTDGFARSLTIRLRSLIRAAVRVTPLANATLTAESANKTNETRSIVCVWQPHGLLDSVATVLSPLLVATFVDRLLGGRSTPNGEPPDQHRPLTEVDQRLAAKLTEAVRLSVIEQAATTSNLELTNHPHATNCADVWLPDCLLLRLSYELQFVQGGGSLDLLLPLDVAADFADEPMADPVPPTPSESTSATTRRSTVVAQFAPTTLSGDELQSLSVGDVLPLDSATDQSLRVLMDGRLRFHAAAGTIHGHKAFRLTAAASTTSAR